MSPKLIILSSKKLLYAILITERKLRHYFEYYKIAVVTEFPLGDILRNKEANGRIIKWVVELGTYSIEFRSRPTIKSQALADFIAEWTEIQEPIAATCPEHWVMYFDGALNINGAGVGILFIMPTKDKLRYILRIRFLASNNAAEYEACLHGLHIAVELGVKRLMVYGDSTLVINQLNKDWSCANDKMNAYCTEIRKLEGKFYDIEYHHGYATKIRSQITCPSWAPLVSWFRPGSSSKILWRRPLKKKKNLGSPTHRAAGTYGTFAGHRLEGTVHQVPLQHRRTCQQDQN